MDNEHIGQAEAHVDRYALRHVAPNPPPWGPVVFVGTLIIIALIGNVMGIVIFAPLSILGLYFWWRPPRYDFWVELDDEGISVRALTRIRMRYGDIRTAEPRTYPSSVLMGLLTNGILRFGNFFGATWDLEGEPGAVDPYGVVVRFRKWMWFVAPLPPLLIPRRNWLFVVEDGPALLRGIRSRLKD